MDDTRLTNFIGSKNDHNRKQESKCIALLLSARKLLQSRMFTEICTLFPFVVTEKSAIKFSTTDRDIKANTVRNKMQFKVVYQRVHLREQLSCQELYSYTH